jgi:hypothetical protein
MFYPSSCRARVLDFQASFKLVKVLERPSLLDGKSLEFSRIPYRLHLTVVDIETSLEDTDIQNEIKRSIKWALPKQLETVPRSVNLSKQGSGTR